MSRLNQLLQIGALCAVLSACHQAPTATDVPDSAPEPAASAAAASSNDIDLVGRQPAPHNEPWLDELTQGFGAELRAIIERAALCQHFSGEFGGDHSERDQALKLDMQTYRCDTIAADVATAKKRYKNNAAFLAALRKIEE